MFINRIRNYIGRVLHPRKTLFTNLSKMVLIVPLIFAVSCGESVSERVDDVGGLTARQVVENPNAYVGKNITISGAVEEIHNPQAFTMDSGLNDDLLILGREPYPQVAEAGNRAYWVSDVATVTGVIRNMTAADVEREIGWNIAPELESRFTGKPVMIAQTVNFRPGSAGAAASNANNAQTATNTGQSIANTNTNQQTTGNVITDQNIYASTADKSSLMNREADFTNVQVIRVLDPRAFTIPSGNEELYVILNEESERGIGTQGNIKRGDTLSVKGTFKRLDDQALTDIAGRRIRPLTNTEREYLKNTQIFLLADQISNLKNVE